VVDDGAFIVVLVWSMPVEASSQPKAERGATAVRIRVTSRCLDGAYQTSRGLEELVCGQHRLGGRVLCVGRVRLLATRRMTVGGFLSSIGE